MKHLTLLCLLGFVAWTSTAQQFMTRSGNVGFFSATPIENIEAHNHQMSGLLDASNGGFAFQVQMRGFHFEKALMEEHFNENYVESDTYPKATYQGTIEGWDNAWNDGETHQVVASGTFDIHGVKAPKDVEGSLRWNGEAWELSATFDLTLADHDVVIPAVVKDNIAPQIEVTVDATLDPR